jgi:hypothetical protein
VRVVRVAAIVVVVAVARLGSRPEILRHQVLELLQKLWNLPMERRGRATFLFAASTRATAGVAAPAPTLAALAPALEVVAVAVHHAQLLHAAAAAALVAFTHGVLVLKLR